MKRSRFFGLAVAVVVAGLGAGYWLGAGVLAPEPPARMAAMWAFNYTNLEEMTRGVHAVVVAEAQQSYPGRVLRGPDGAETPFTLTDFAVVSRIQGDIGDVFTIERTGGLTENHEFVSIDDGGPFTQGQRYVLFLRAQEGTGYFILPNPQGRFQVDETGRLRAVVPADPAARPLDGLSTDQAVKRIAAGKD